jgi:two-component system chemotaxis response regulator CheB
VTREVIVIGGSAGAFEPLKGILSELPASLPASIFVVIHTSPDTPGMLPALLGRSTALTVAFAEHDQAIEPGRVYVAPPDHHLLLAAGRVLVTRGPRENGFRPAVDPLFRTAADVYGARVVGIVLSGGLDDGTRGLADIGAAGGTTIAQRPDEALTPGMPASAIRGAAVDHVVSAAEIGPLVARLVAEAPVDPAGAEEKDLTMPHDVTNDPAARGLHALKDHTYPGSPSAFTCPECGGALWELEAGTRVRYACHVGHSYTPDALENGMAAALEAALWTALRVLEENAAFFRRMENRATTQRLGTIATGYATKATDAELRAEVVRRALVDEPAPSIPTPDSSISTLASKIGA